MTPTVDPAAFAASLVDLEESTARLLESLAELTDTQAREPSRLPGWSRGHVLTHLARNADGMANLTQWATTGTVTPMYPSLEARAADIEAGAARPAADLVADVRDSAARLRAGLREVAGAGPDALAYVVTFGPGPSPAASLPLHRRTEVEVHRVDLGLGYTPDRWPEQFAAWLGGDRAGRRASAEGLAGIGALVPDEGGRWSLLEPAAGAPDRTLDGPVRWLAAWLMGRDVPGGLLRTSDGSPVPPAPPL